MFSPTTRNAVFAAFALIAFALTLTTIVSHGKINEVPHEIYADEAPIVPVPQCGGRPEPMEPEISDAICLTEVEDTATDAILKPVELGECVEHKCGGIIIEEPGASDVLMPIEFGGCFSYKCDGIIVEPIPYNYT